ncbi:putative MFS glucose transporter [Aspergillus stella-maris]|uniref:putative MFS glucose transporter n=1 Tax=Aspergillus stella-maris TaxID=1810926 RepID=UPI003CCD3BA1
MARSRVTPYLIYLVFITTLGPLQFGYHLAELNAPQAVITCERKNIHSSSISDGLPQCIPMNPSQFGLVSSIYTLGGFVGAVLAGPVSTKHGRLFALRAMTIFFIAGPVAETLAPNIPILGIGRLLSGIGSGASIVVGPIYVSEIAPPSAKGFFGAFTQIMTNVGILLTQTLGYFLSEGSKWRVILAVAGLIGALELVGLTLVPESPAWLTDHQKHDRAWRVLQRIRGKDADIREELEGPNGSARSEEEAGEEQSLLSPPASNLPPKQPPVTMTRVIMDPAYRPAIIAVVGVMIAQQFSGINSIIMYSVSLLQSILPTTAALLSVVISAINLVMTLACSPLPDKIGRKSCLLYSISGMGVNSILLAFGIYFNLRALSAIAVLLFVASFAVGVGPVPFILASELVGPEAVGATQSWALAANWISTFVVAQFFPMLNDALGGRGKIYWLFAAMSGLFAGFIYWRVPETKGKRNVEEVWGREDQRRED